MKPALRTTLVALGARINRTPGSDIPRSSSLLQQAWGSGCLGLQPGHGTPWQASPRAVLRPERHCSPTIPQHPSALQRASRATASAIRPLFALLTLAFLATTAAAQQCVSIVNRDFENYTVGVLDNWDTSTPSPAVDGVADAHSGDSYLRFDDAAPTLYVEQVDVLFPVAESIRITFFANPAAATDGQITIHAGSTVVTFTHQDLLDIADFDGGGWTNQAVEVPLPDALADGNRRTIRVEGTGFSAGSSILIDDICLSVPAGSPGSPGGPCDGNELGDPSFEDGVASLDWQSTSPTNPITQEASEAHTGQWYARFINDASQLEQTFTLATTSDYTLAFYLQIPATGGTGTLSLTIDGLPVAQWTQTNQPSHNTYTLKQFNLSAYADGQPHVLAFQSTGDQEFRIDTVCAAVPSGGTGGGGGCAGNPLFPYGDFEPIPPATCPDAAEELAIRTAWDGDPFNLITTCTGTDGVAGSPGYAHFQPAPAGGVLSQSGIVLDASVNGVFLSFFVRMPNPVADGETLIATLVNEVSGETIRIWPRVADDDLQDYYNDTLGDGDYVQIATAIAVTNADPEPYTLRFEREGAAEFYLDDICVFAGGAVCTGGGTPTMTVLSSNTFADIDEDDDNYIGRAVTATIQLQYPVGSLSVCTSGGGLFDLQTQDGCFIPLNENLSYIDVTNGLLEFQIDTASITVCSPIDGRTLMVIDGAPLIDDFIIDTVPPIVGPPLVSVAGTPSLDDLLNTTTLPGYTGLSFISASTSDNLTGSAAAGIAGAPGVVNNLQPGNFYYEPWDTVYTADNRILTYATRAGRPARVFFNDTPPLELTVQCNFYDPPLEDEASGYLSIASGFNTTLDNYTIEGSIVPTGPATWIQPADAVPSIQDTDTVNGHVANHATATWNINQAAPLGSAANDVYLNLRSNFFARDRAGNVRTLQESVLDGLEIWWMERAQSRLTPDWSGVRPTPDQVYFDFAMDRTYSPNPLGAPLPIFNIEVFVGGPDPTDPTLAAFSTLGWVGWTPARRLTSAYFQDLVAGNPTLGNRWYAVRLVGADEAGNFETPPTIDLSTGTSGRNWQVFFLTGQEQSIDTTLGARFWWDSGNDLSRFNPNEGDQDVGSSNIVPMPPASVPHVVAVRFDIGAIAPQNIPLNTVSIAWQLEDEQTGDTIEDIYWYPTERTIRITMPFDYAIFFGDPNRQVVRTYTFRAAARYEIGGNLVQDPTPAVFRFRVVPGTVQQYLEDIADPQDQPIREVQRLD